MPGNSAPDARMRPVTKRPAASQTIFDAVPAVLGNTPAAWENPVFLFLLCIAPLVLYTVNHNWTFQGLGHMDNWYYAGFFNHALADHPDAYGYPGERLSWNVPGH